VGGVFFSHLPITLPLILSIYLVEGKWSLYAAPDGGSKTYGDRKPLSVCSLTAALYFYLRSSGGTS